jgi:hypothetical protein
MFCIRKFWVSRIREKAWSRKKGAKYKYVSTNKNEPQFLETYKKAQSVK